jgi:uncharacterized Zn finger protein
MRCVDCGTTHPLQKERERLANVRVIVNRDGLSQPYNVNLPAEDDLRVGGELLVDDQVKDVVLAEITSLETDRRVETATAREVKTVWARAVDNVTLKVSVYNNGVTRPLSTQASGKDVFERGEVLEMDGIRFQVIKIKLRGEGFADRAEAKDIVRVWGREL